MTVATGRGGRNLKAGLVNDIKLQQTGEGRRPGGELGKQQLQQAGEAGRRAW